MAPLLAGDTLLVTEMLGLACSLGAWLGGMAMLLRVQRVAISKLPDPWRHHPELQEVYARTGQLRVADVFHQRTSLARWLVVLTGYAAALGVLDVPFAMTLLLAAAVAFASAYREIVETRKAQREREAALVLEPLAVDLPLAASYALSELLAKAGFYLAPACLGYLLLDLARLI